MISLRWGIGAFIALLALLFSFQLVGDPKYEGVHIGIKFVHVIEHFLFYACGAYHGTDRFYRSIWDISQIKVGSGSGGLWGSDDVTSEDVLIPSSWKNDMGTGFEVPARLYYPTDLLERPRKLPVMVYFHGGGFVLISHEDLLYDILSRAFVSEGEFIVLSVGYRLAPENKFPAALMDAYSAVQWVMDEKNVTSVTDCFDKKKIIVAGDSSGAMLALGVSLLARDRNEMNYEIAAQILLYPGTYYNVSTPSFELYGEDSYLFPQGKLTAKWFHEQYTDQKTNHWRLSDEDDYDSDIQQLEVIPEENDKFAFPLVTQPYLNPWSIPSLEGLPFTFTIVGEYDPLRDENVLLIQKMKNEGVRTLLSVVPHSVHGFFVLPFLPETFTTRTEIINVINIRLGEYQDMGSRYRS